MQNIFEKPQKTRPFNIYKITEQLSEFESQNNYYRVAPIWGSRMSAQEYFELSRSRAETGRRLLLPAEIGCAMAHVHAYQMIQRLNCAGVIMEDDITASAEQIEKITSTISHLKTADFIHLAKYKHRFDKTLVEQDIYVADTSAGFWGTAAYYISPAMADYLLTKHRDFIELADNWQEFFVGSPFIPYYAPIFEHTGENTKIGPNRSISQNASIFGAINLRVLRWRMRYLATFRHIRNAWRSRQLLQGRNAQT